MAQQTSRARTVCTGGESNRAVLLRAWLRSNGAGSIVVLACLLLPVVLGALSVTVEDAAQAGYIQALQAAALTTPLPEATPPLAGGPPMLDQHYYFISGCVAAPEDCVLVESRNWGEYYAELRHLYEEAAQSTPAPAAAFEEWAGQHVHIFITPNAAAGAAMIAQALQANGTSRSIHLLGTSVGGAALFSYLSQAMRGDRPLDRRIRSVLAIDPPLGDQYLFPTENLVGGLVNGLEASVMRTDVQQGIGPWAQAAHIAVLTVNTRQDVVGYDPPTGVDDDPNPIYPQSDAPPPPRDQNCRSLSCWLRQLPERLDESLAWHMYTGSHMANSARQFIDQHWR